MLYIRDEEKLLELDQNGKWPMGDEISISIDVAVFRTHELFHVEVPIDRLIVEFAGSRNLGRFLVDAVFPSADPNSK